MKEHKYESAKIWSTAVKVKTKKQNIIIEAAIRKIWNPATTRNFYLLLATFHTHQLRKDS